MQRALMENLCNMQNLMSNVTREWKPCERIKEIRNTAKGVKNAVAVDCLIGTLYTTEIQSLNLKMCQYKLPKLESQEEKGKNKNPRIVKMGNRLPEREFEQKKQQLIPF